MLTVALVLSGCGDSGAPDKELSLGKELTPTEEDSGLSDRTDGGAGKAQLQLAAAEAKDYFWEAFSQERLENAEAATEKLAAVYEIAPENPSNTLLLGLSYLWPLAEFERHPDLQLFEQPQLAYNARRYLLEAQELAPNDGRIYGWLAPVGLGLAEGTGDAQLAVEARAELERGVEEYPQFNLFSRALEDGDEPRDSEAFAQAIEDLWTQMELCLGEELGREEQDLKKMAIAVAEGTTVISCGNTPRAPHSIEGVYLFMGDLFVKAGAVEMAQAAYAAARFSPGYEQWPYAKYLGDKEASLNERAALFADEDASNDPELVSNSAVSCGYCHAAQPNEARP